MDRRSNSAIMGRVTPKIHARLIPPLTALTALLMITLPVSIAAGEKPVYRILSVNPSEISPLDSDDNGSTWWLSGQIVPPRNTDRGCRYPGSGLKRAAEGLESCSGNVWRHVRVPANPLARGDLKTGTRRFTYRKSFRFKNRAHRQLALRLGMISDRDRTFLNGHPIGESGLWGERLPQAYERIRIYEIPPGLIREGKPNTLLIQVEGYFPNEAGLYRDRIEIGPAREIWETYYLEITLNILIQTFYLTVGSYFLFLFVRRRKEPANLLFGIFIIFLVIYLSLRTQIKYVLGADFMIAKRAEYISLFLLVPLFYYFNRIYYSLPRKRWVKIMDIALIALTAVPLGSIIAVMVTDSAVFWWAIFHNIIQPVWAGYVVGLFIILFNRMLERDTDAFIMIGGALILIITAIIDVLVDRGQLMLPLLTPYGFFAFILSFTIILANRFVRLQKETDRLNIVLEGQARSFHRFVPTQFLELLGKSDMTSVDLGDCANLNMSVLFSDLRAFTSLSEGMGPEDNFRFLNSYLMRMEPEIKRHGGFVDKFMGDAIMALFPENGRGPSSLQAVLAAIRMRTVLTDYNTHRQSLNYPPIDFGIGINSGGLMLGTVGSSERLDTTVIGDSVNVAARLESLTGVYQASIIISENARRHLQNAEIALREIDTIIVRGRTEPIVIFEVFEADEPGPRKLKLRTRDLLAEAIALYKARQFTEAIGIVEHVLGLNPDDKVARIYLKRCHKLLETPPPENWRGTVRVRYK